MSKLDEIPGQGSPAASKPKKAKKPNFTLKEKQFLKGYVEEVIPGKKTKRELAMEVYDTKDPNTASAIASENLSKPKFQDFLQEAFEEAGITPGSIADVLKEAMSATKTASLQGEVFPSDEPDHTVRVSAAKAAATLMGAGKDDDGKGGTTFNFNLPGSSQTFVKKVEVKK